MGWGSAVDIIDLAIKAADDAATEVLNFYGPELGVDPHLGGDLRRDVDNAIRPHVRQLATKLRDNDWDNIEDSDYFERFPREMYGHSDGEHERYLRDRLEKAVLDQPIERIMALALDLKNHLDQTRKAAQS